MKPPELYFSWLQHDNPTGPVEHFPWLENRFETSVPGLYCIGDLTGVPLIKLAAESGFNFIEWLSRDPRFAQDRLANKDPGVFNLIVAGAGVSGVSASLRARDLGLSHLVIEASRIFNTVENFPAGKPIYVTPRGVPQRSSLTFADGTKETLLDQLHSAVRGKSLPLHEGETVQSITGHARSFTVETGTASYRALRVVVAIGKTGNARSLGVPGERLQKVFTRLIDPAAFAQKNILVVGGGDSAVEAAIALVKAGNRVTLSYRARELSRPKEQSRQAFASLVNNRTLTFLPGSTVKEVRESEVLLATDRGDTAVPNDIVFVLIGTELPKTFLRRSTIRMEGEKRLSDRISLAAMLLFASLLYFGKKAPVTVVSGIGGFWGLPAMLSRLEWPALVSGLIAWASFLGFAVAGFLLLTHVVANAGRYFSTGSQRVKYGYCALVAVAFPILYISYKIAGRTPLLSDMGDWYAVVYSLTIVLFGLRRIRSRRTAYITRQTVSLMAFQCIGLCILPLFIIPLLGRHAMLPGWFIHNVVPHESYWRVYGLILAWPLFIYNLAQGQPTLFWLVAGLVQTFVLIPAIVYKWGKGAYCGWICSCGGLAETLGEEYRTMALHGVRAKRAENAGQILLWIAAAATLTALAAGGTGTPFSRTVIDVYGLLVDIVCAGVLGLGAYFFLSGRVWCRFLCPLAALMHVYARFSLYRIFANKKRCISCNICTRVCHMGIDVMGYANKGIPMNDVECVRCSACVASCPLSVLTFGSVHGPDPNNVAYKSEYPAVNRGWASGLPEKDTAMLVEDEEKERHTGSQPSAGL